MPEPKTEATAAAGDYRPKINVELTYDGATITWKNTPDSDRVKFVETIRGYAEELKGLYRVRTELGSGDLELMLTFKTTSTALGRQIMKGVENMIKGDTIWGGGGS